MACKLTQKELAARLGVERDSVEKWENGKRAANWTMLDLALNELHRRLELERRDEADQS